MPIRLFHVFFLSAFELVHVSGQVIKKTVSFINTKRNSSPEKSAIHNI